MEQIANEHRFQVCPGCGNLTPADAAQCEYCGFRSPEAVAAQRESELIRRFSSALFTRSNPFTYIFIGINLGIFVLMWLAGGMGVMSTNSEVLVGFGAKQNELIDAQNQYWRFVTSIFIHIGFLHLLFNNYALWILGQEIERLYGSSRFVLLYLTTGVAGSVASYFYAPEATSAGASGAIFGLAGVLATFAFRYRKEIPAIISRDIRSRVLPLIVINLAFGFSVQGIDNAAHIGGLLTGVLLGLLVPYKRPQEKATTLAWRAFLLICLGIIFYSFMSAFRSYTGPLPRLANLTAKPGGGVRDYFEGMKGGIDALRESGEYFATVLTSRNPNADTSVPLQRIEQGIRSVENAPRVDDQGEKYRQQLLAILGRQRKLIERFNADKQKDWRGMESELEKIADSYLEFQREFEPWLIKFLQSYGYKLQKEPQDNNE